MKAVIQHVENCTLSIEQQTEPFSQIDKGLLILLGICNGDTQADAEKLVKKISTLRIFPDENDKMNYSCTHEFVNGKFMVVSQFTLCADCTHGRRPDMFSAAKPDIAEPLYRYFSDLLNEEAKNMTNSDCNFVVNGVFGAHMKISFTNIGPQTFIIESSDLK